MGFFSELDIELTEQENLVILKKEKTMSAVEIIHKLSKYFDAVYDMKVAVNNHRKINENWNWVDAAENLLNVLEGK